MIIEELIIEVTRRCNMSCPHCLRGDAENLNVGFNYIDRVLEDVSRIGYIVFTGGEPSLNIPAIIHTLNRCKEKNIDVENFYVVTNGKLVSWDFIVALMEWNCFVSSRETPSVALSRDIYHEEINEENIQRLRGLSFFSEEEKNNNTFEYGLIDEGRAKELSVNKRKKHYYVNDYELCDSEIVVNGQIYLSADGKIKTDCDTAFNNNECVIGDIKKESLMDIVRRDAKL